MSAFSKTIIRTGLETLYFSGAYMAMRPFVAGVGAILTLHHVRPARPDRFQPNRLLEITPQFLDDVLRYLRAAHVDLVSLDAMHRRLTDSDFRRRFVCITIDDGYRDTLQWAYPILKREAVPFTVYVPTSFPDRLGELWWLAIEAVVARNRGITLLVDDREQSLDCVSVADKRHASTSSITGRGGSGARTSCAAPCVTPRLVVRSISCRSARNCAWAGTARDACRRPARDHRRSHRQPCDARQSAGESRAPEMEMSRTVIKAALACGGAFVLSDRRQHGGRSARVPIAAGLGFKPP